MVFPGKNNYGIRIEGSWTEQTWKHLQRYFCYEKYCAFRLFKLADFPQWQVEFEVLANSEKASGRESPQTVGYTAVLIALVAFNNPIGVFFVAVLYAAMQVGASSMQRQLEYRLQSLTF